MTELNLEKFPDRDTAELFLSEVAKVHKRFDKAFERIQKLEDNRSPHHHDDPMARMMLWIGVAYVASMLIPMLIEVLRGEKCEA